MPDRRSRSVPRQAAIDAAVLCSTCIVGCCAEMLRGEIDPALIDEDRLRETSLILLKKNEAFFKAKAEEMLDAVMAERKERRHSHA